MMKAIEIEAVEDYGVSKSDMHNQYGYKRKGISIHNVEPDLI